MARFTEQVTLYHNPRCSKSRAALALLQAQGVEPEIVLYLESPPSANDSNRRLFTRTSDRPLSEQ